MNDRDILLNLMIDMKSCVCTIFHQMPNVVHNGVVWDLQWLRVVMDGELALNNAWGLMD